MSKRAASDRPEDAPAGDRGAVPGDFAPSRPPSGTANFGNLLRDPGLVLSEIVAREVAAAGFADLRPSLLAVGQHVGADGTRITELAKRSQLTKATVVAAVDELERLGYAERVEDPSDGRAKLVRPTERAHRAEDAARKAIAETRDVWARGLGGGRMDELERALLDLRALLWPEHR